MSESEVAAAEAPKKVFPTPSASSTEPVANTIVWAQCKPWPPWPALIFDKNNKPPQLALESAPSVPHVPVIFYGTREVGYMTLDQLILPFEGANFDKYSKASKPKFVKSLAAAVREATETPEVLQFDFGEYSVSSSEGEESSAAEEEEEEKVVVKKKKEVPKKRKQSATGGEAKKVKKSNDQPQPVFKRVPEKISEEDLLSLRHKLQRILLGKDILKEELMRAKQIFERLNNIEPEVEKLKTTKILKALRMIAELKIENDPYNLAKCSADLQDNWKKQLLSQQPVNPPEATIKEESKQEE